MISRWHSEWRNLGEDPATALAFFQLNQYLWKNGWLCMRVCTCNCVIKLCKNECLFRVCFLCLIVFECIYARASVWQ
jgi:hypothetical protein